LSKTAGFPPFPRFSRRFFAPFFGASVANAPFHRGYFNRVVRVANVSR